MSVVYLAENLILILGLPFSREQTKLMEEMYMFEIKVISRMRIVVVLMMAMFVKVIFPFAAADGYAAGTTGGSGFSQSDNRVKPRLIATTDGEVDDRSTMIRFLMYSCDFDIVGIVQNNSKYQKSGHSGEKWIEKGIRSVCRCITEP